MTITPEMLAAYADGELDYDDIEQVEAAIDADPLLASQVAAHRALRARLNAHFNRVLLEPLPHLLTPPVPETKGITQLASAREARDSRRSLSIRWLWPAGGAIAAILVVAVTFGGKFLQEGSGLTNSTIAALDGQPSGAPGATRVLLSFVDKAGYYCRVYVEHGATGIACRAGGEWDVRWRQQGGMERTGEMRQANSAEVFAEAQRMSAGEALDAREEARAINENWSR